MGEFKGIWIDKSITDLALPPTQKIVLGMIREMQPFHASNSYIADKLSITSRGVQKIMKELKEKKLIEISGNTSARIITTEQSSIDNYRTKFASTTEQSSHTYEQSSPTTEQSSPNSKDTKNIKVYSKVEIPYYQAFLDKWNSIDTLPTHEAKTIKANFKAKHEKILKLYKEEDILSAIDSYGIVLGSDNYWYTYRYTFLRFLEKIESFVPNMKPLENYKNKTYSSTAKKTNLLADVTF